jgi:hypothetical protein
MIILLLFINLFAPCNSDITYSKMLNVTENSEQTIYHGFVKGHMNIDDVMYDKLYIDKIVWYLEDRISVRIITMDGGIYYCDAWTVMLTTSNLNKEVRNCMCEHSGLHYLFEKFINSNNEAQKYRSFYR